MAVVASFKSLPIIPIFFIHAILFFIASGVKNDKYDTECFICERILTYEYFFDTLMTAFNIQTVISNLKELQNKIQ
jgi:hypothetical protein